MQGARLSERDRHRLTCQLRLLRLLGGLPADGACLSEADKSCITRAAEGVERELLQLRWVLQGRAAWVLQGQLRWVLQGQARRGMAGWL